MANITTMAQMWWDLMHSPSIEGDRCAVCGRGWPLNRHHMVPRSAGELYEDGRKLKKPTIVLCGFGNAGGCHGLAHSGKLHFRFTDRLEYLLTNEPVKRLEALEMDGWRPL